MNTMRSTAMPTTVSLAVLRSQDVRMAAELLAAKEVLAAQTKHVEQLEAAYLQNLHELNVQEVAEMDTTNWPLLLQRTPLEGTSRSAEMLRTLLYGGSVVGDGVSGLRQGGGVHRETGQFALQVQLRQGDVELTEKTCKLLSEILPSYLPTSRDGAQPYKRIEVRRRDSESSLSRSHYLAINEDSNMYEARTIEWGRLKHVHKTDSLLALLTYVQENHPYKLKPSWKR